MYPSSSNDRKLIGDVKTRPFPLHFNLQTPSFSSTHIPVYIGKWHKAFLSQPRSARTEPDTPAVPVKQGDPNSLSDSRGTEARALQNLSFRSTESMCLVCDALLLLLRYDLFYHPSLTDAGSRLLSCWEVPCLLSKPWLWHFTSG